MTKIKQSDVCFLLVVDGACEIEFFVRCKDTATADALMVQITSEMGVVTAREEYAGSVSSKKEMLDIYEDEDDADKTAFLRAKATDDNTVSNIACFRYVGKHVFSVETGI